MASAVSLVLISLSRLLTSHASRQSECNVHICNDKTLVETFDVVIAQLCKVVPSLTFERIDMSLSQAFPSFRSGTKCSSVYLNNHSPQAHVYESYRLTRSAHARGNTKPQRKLEMSCVSIESSQSRQSCYPRCPFIPLSLNAALGRTASSEKLHIRSVSDVHRLLLIRRSVLNAFLMSSI